MRKPRKIMRHDRGLMKVGAQYGTCYQGSVDVDFDTICAVFGRPSRGDGYKVQREWVIMTPKGIATIYDWKEGSCYLGRGKGTHWTKVRDWHIGGNTPDVVEEIKAALKSYHPV